MKNWPSFERLSSKVLSDSPFFRKIWRVSQILKCSPFGDEIKDLTNIQIDFILRMYAEDHPDEFKYMDSDIKHGEAAPQIQTEWFNRLRGRAAKEFAFSPTLFLRKYHGWDTK